MNFILPLILIASSIGVFFGYVDPNYKGAAVQSTTDYSKGSIIFLQSELAKYKAILDSSTQIVTKRDELIKKKNTITSPDQTRLESFLPSGIDNVRLIIEINEIASNRNLATKSISFGSLTPASTGAIGQDNSPYGTFSLKFTVNSTYNNFLNFLQDLENNLRLLDVSDISFTSTDNGFYDFNVSLNTYWLK